MSYSVGEDAENAIKELINRETEAWDTQNIHLLMSIFHHDMVWPWPLAANDHDPIKWSMGFGRFDYGRWSREWLELFNTYDLLHNHRTTQKIEISRQKDGAFAVVDIDTLWQHKKTGEFQHWIGRTCKVYTKMQSGEWKFIMQTGVLNYQ